MIRGDVVSKLLLAATAVVALSGFGAANASTVTLDLSGQPTGAIGTFTSNGYTVTPLPGDPGDQVNILNVGGSNVLVDGAPADVFGSQMLITRTAGGTFNLVSFDLANLQNPGYGVFPVGTGGGFRVELDGAPGGVADAYTTGSSTFTTVTPGNLTGLTSLYINFVSFTEESLDFAMDNIKLSANAVPEPVSLTLLGIGVIGLGVVRRGKGSRSRSG